MSITTISVAVMILGVVILHFLEAIGGVLPAGGQLIWVLIVGFGGVIRAIEKNRKSR